VNPDTDYTGSCEPRHWLHR